MLLTRRLASVDGSDQSNGLGKGICRRQHKHIEVIRVTHMTKSGYQDNKAQELVSVTCTEYAWLRTEKAKTNNQKNSVIMPSQQDFGPLPPSSQ